MKSPPNVDLASKRSKHESLFINMINCSITMILKLVSIIVAEDSNMRTFRLIIQSLQLTFTVNHEAKKMQTMFLRLYVPQAYMLNV